MVKNFFEKLMKAKRARKGRKLFEAGLEGRELASAKILGEARPRLLLLCSTPKGKIYALAGASEPLLLLGRNLKAKRAVVLDTPSDWIWLEGSLEGLRVPLVVATGVEPC